MSAQNSNETTSGQYRSPELPVAARTGRMPDTLELQSRRSFRPQFNLVIPSQTHQDPSDLPEHIDRKSPCSMLADDLPTLAPCRKVGSPPQRPKVSIRPRLLFYVWKAVLNVTCTRANRCESLSPSQNSQIHPITRRTVTSCLPAPSSSRPSPLLCILLFNDSRRSCSSFEFHSMDAPNSCRCWCAATR